MRWRSNTQRTMLAIVDLEERVSQDSRPLESLLKASDRLVLGVQRTYLLGGIGVQPTLSLAFGHGLVGEQFQWYRLHPKPACSCWRTTWANNCSTRWCGQPMRRACCRTSISVWTGP